MKLTTKQTERLVNACVQNDRSAQEALYRLYYADMARVCSNYLADEELAQEALNTGFMRVFESIQSFDLQKGGLSYWIRRIMIFASIDLYRAEMKFSNLTVSLPEKETDFISPEALDKLYFEDILQHIRTLPYATQTVFNLSVIDGFSHKEIADQLGISEGTSRWHLSEAKRLLRELLEKTPNRSRPAERRERV